MPTVDLVYDADCPNIAAARTQLLLAFAAAKIPPRWNEWRGDNPDSPEHVKGRGSPAVLVDGQDVASNEAHTGAACCRLYPQTDGGLRGVPEVETIVAALAAPLSDSTGRWRAGAATLPAIGMSLLPKVACPACWPAYAGILSSVGLGFLIDTTYLLPITAVFLAVAVGALAFRARRRRGFGPFTLGLVASIVVLVGKFGLDSDPAMYAGLAILVGSSLWNSWPIKTTGACSSCAPQQKGSQP